MSKITLQIIGPVAHKHSIYHAERLGIHVDRVLKALAIAAVSTGVVVALQLAYPATRALPGTNFAGYSLGLASKNEIMARLEGINNKQFKAAALTEDYTTSLHEVGLSADTVTIADQLSDYPLSKRVLPFSFFFHENHVETTNLAVTDQAKLDAFAAKVAAANNKAPVEGSIRLEANKPIITYSTPGVEYRSEDIASYFKAFSSGPGNEATLPFNAIAPINSREHLDDLAAQVETLARSELKVNYEGGEQIIPGTLLVPSVRFLADDQTKLIEFDFDHQVLTAQLENTTDAVFVAPSATAGGHELNRGATADAVLSTLRQNNTVATAVMKPIQPTSTKVYPATSKGLQSLIEDWKKSHAAIEPAIVFAEIGAMGRKASIDADVKYFSASVYKVFPAWYALDQMDQGKLDPNGVVAAGLKLDACFQNMIIVSASECAESIIAKYGGWGVLDTFIKEHGINGIALSSGVSISAHGMTEFLRKLDAGELLSPERTTYLLDAMKRQKYRTGVPAGSAGPVADKVGYQPKTYSWHDAAIVYHPNGKYTLVVLTHQGASLPTLSTLAKQISDTLSR